MRALGATEQQILEARLDAVKTDFVVWEENRETVQMFMRMQTQWRIGFGGPTGLDYAPLDWLCRLYLVKDPARLFEGLQIMEVTALSCISKNKR